MVRLILILVLLATMQSAFAGSEFKSKEDFAQWLTFYYENPEPNRVPDAIQYLSQSGALDNHDTLPPMFGFLSGVFRSNPEKINPWLKQLNKLNEQHLEVVTLGLWYSGLPDSQSKVYVLLDKHPKLKSKLSILKQGAPMTIEQIPLEQGPWVLDALWGKFMATGENIPVERIITTLPWIDVKGDINRLQVGGAANWSLTSNAIQHKRVLKICEENVKIQTGEVREKLMTVIERAKKELETTVLPSNSTDTQK